MAYERVGHGLVSGHVGASGEEQLLDLRKTTA